MNPEPVPDWLAAWRAGRPPSAPPKPTPPPPPPPAPVARRTDRLGFSEAVPWADDGGLRREPVVDVDHTPPRVVRRIGWMRCLRCRRSFFSEDVVRQRLCSGPDGCRAQEGRYVA